MPATKPTEFRALPEYRRCSLWAVRGMSALSAIAWVMRAYATTPPLYERKVIACAALTCACIMMAILVHSYRLRLDERGLWRRWLFRWELWPWEVFASGQVRQL